MSPAGPVASRKPPQLLVEVRQGSALLGHRSACHSARAHGSRCGARKVTRRNDPGRLSPHGPRRHHRGRRRAAGRHRPGQLGGPGGRRPGRTHRLWLPPRPGRRRGVGTPGRAAGPKTSRPSWSPTRTSTTSAPCPSCVVGTASRCLPATWRHATCGERCTNRPHPRDVLLRSYRPRIAAWGMRAALAGGTRRPVVDEVGTIRPGCPSTSLGRRSRSPSSVTPVVTRLTSYGGPALWPPATHSPTGHPTSARTGPQVLLDFFHHDPPRPGKRDPARPGCGARRTSSCRATASTSSGRSPWPSNRR